MLLKNKSKDEIMREIEDEKWTKGTLLSELDRTKSAYWLLRICFAFTFFSFSLLIPFYFLSTWLKVDSIENNSTWIYLAASLVFLIVLQIFNSYKLNEIFEILKKEIDVMKFLEKVNKNKQNHEFIYCPSTN